MAALGSQSIASSYEQLLHVDADGGGNTTTHVSVKDGDNGTTFGFTIASDALMMSSTNRLEFGDTGTYIHQSADGVLDLVSDTEIEINATTIDMNGALDLSGNAQLSGTVTVGADGSGTDVIFYSGTAGDNFTWDASDEKLIITGTNGTTALDVADGNVSITDDLSVDGTANLDNTDIDGTLTQDAGNVVFNEASADYDFRVESSGDANMLFVDGGEDRVGVATNSPGGLLSVYAGNQTSHANAASGILIGNGTGANSVGQVGFGPNGGTNPAAYYGYLQTSGTGSTNGALVLGTRSGTGDDLPTERMRIESGGDIDIQTGDIFFSTAGKGICLGVTSNTDSNTLDDYEEGSWTPILTDSSNNASAYSGQVGSYTKIGRQVNLYLDMSTSNIGSVSGSIYIGGMPFTSNSSGARGACVFGYQSGFAITATTHVTAYVEASDTKAVLEVLSATTGVAAMQHTEWSADGRVIGTITYQAT